MTCLCVERASTRYTRRKSRRKSGAPSNIEEEAFRGHISRGKSTGLCLSVDDEVVGVLLLAPAGSCISSRTVAGGRGAGKETNKLMETLCGTETTVGS
jgi:hypothetical protein